MDDSRISLVGLVPTILVGEHTKSSLHCPAFLPLLPVLFHLDTIPVHLVCQVGIAIPLLDLFLAFSWCDPLPFPLIALGPRISTNIIAIPSSSPVCLYLVLFCLDYMYMPHGRSFRLLCRLQSDHHQPLIICRCNKVFRRTRYMTSTPLIQAK